MIEPDSKSVKDKITDLVYQIGFRLDIDNDRAMLAALEHYSEALNDYEAAMFFSGKMRKEWIRIAVNDVVYCEASDKFVEIRSKQKYLVLDISLKSIQEKYPDRFLAIHRNCIVDPNRIESITGNKKNGFDVVMVTGHVFSVARRRSRKVRDAFLCTGS